MTARRLWNAVRQDGLLSSVSARALINLLPILTSLAQLGTNPHRTVRSCRFTACGSPLGARSSTTRTSWVGATFHDGALSLVTTCAPYRPASSSFGRVNAYLPHMPTSVADRNRHYLHGTVSDHNKPHRGRPSRSTLVRSRQRLYGALNQPLLRVASFPTRIGLTSIMFHYPSHSNGRCNLLGADPADLSDIRFVRFYGWLSVRAAGHGPC